MNYLTIQTNETSIFDMFNQNNPDLQSPKLLRNLSMSFYDRYTLFSNKKVICDSLKEDSFNKHKNAKNNRNQVPKFIKDMEKKNELKPINKYLQTNTTTFNKTTKLTFLSPQKNKINGIQQKIGTEQNNTITILRKMYKSPKVPLKRPRFFV